jgi:hypothetical protein
LVEQTRQSGPPGINVITAALAFLLVQVSAANVTKAQAVGLAQRLHRLVGDDVLSQNFGKIQKVVGVYRKTLWIFWDCQLPASLYIRHREAFLFHQYIKGTGELASTPAANQCHPYLQVSLGYNSSMGLEQVQLTRNPVGHPFGAVEVLLYPVVTGGSGGFFQQLCHVVMHKSTK